ncbi:cytochrome C biogenesis protein [Prosthecomicrobium hirschii]|uniref:cytochrome c biogenesis CcdA family protein n=1 Tax=Prosthecodimorpha hirschii TaxID=665126 RepID=UPI00112B5495|nr:cytochrome c biogenesis protein CcdA [Prosthecomicrobium hirschii]TPQ51585.1 cytochrome C biogenesis protein [Prosthecomicrobium hirschii]
MSSSVPLAVAFGGGLISFISPCVLPLVPPYLAYMAGVTIDEYQGAAAESAARRRVVLASAAFVAGFTTVFVILGVSISALGQLVRNYLDLLGTLAGIAIIVMGLHFLGLFRITLLYREARVEMKRRPAGAFGAYLMGLAFAFGWTPCIGPVLSAILAVAGSRDTVGEGAALLAVYSLGLGLPFLAAAFFAGPFLAMMKGLRARLGWVEKGMGVLLVVAGIAFLTGGMQRMAFWLIETFPALSTIG